MSTDYLIGTQLDEYRLDSLLGRGGMARVYRGLDVNLNRPVAIKVIDIPHRTEEEYVQRFKREAQAIGLLDHPHIVRLYRYGEVEAGPVGDSVLYMAMQFIQGADLEFVLNSYRKDGEFLETQEASRIIREVCTALDYAHANGVIHRDIKPSNIMLDQQGRVILTDFGLALLSTQATRGEIFGSPHYIAPEQAMSSAKAVPQSDLYAVGVILYEMFTGVLPFNAAEPLELALMHMNHPVPSPREIRPELSPQLESVIFRALEKQPEDRYPTGEALSGALDKALLEESPSKPVTRMTLPQRVTLGLAIQDLPTLPPTDSGLMSATVQGPEILPTMIDLPGKETPLRPISPGVTDRQALFSDVSSGPGSTLAPTPSQPLVKKRYRIYWMAGALAGFLLFFVCLASTGLFIYNQALANSRTVPTVVARPINPTATPAHVLNPVWKLLTQTPKATSTATTTYSFKIIRSSEDKGYIILNNIGKTDIPLNGLSLHVEKGQLLGSAWGVGQLTKGACLLALKEDRKGKDLPEELTCNFIGHTVTVKKTLDGIYKEKLEVWIGDRLAGTCEKDKSLCLFVFSK